jgi:hypothetical protein
MLSKFAALAPNRLEMSAKEAAREQSFPVIPAGQGMSNDAGSNRVFIATRPDPAAGCIVKVNDD